MLPTANHVVTQTRAELFRNEDVSAQIQALHSQRVERPRFWPLVVLALVLMAAAYALPRWWSGV